VLYTTQTTPTHHYPKEYIMTTNHPTNSRPRRRVLVELQVITAADLTTEELELAVRQDVADSIRGYNYTVKDIDVTADCDPRVELDDQLVVLRLLQEARAELEKTSAELNEAYRWLVMYEELGLADLLQYSEGA
jgi:hypothetical protein